MGNWRPEPPQHHSLECFQYYIQEQIELWRDRISACAWENGAGSRGLNFVRGWGHFCNAWGLLRRDRLDLVLQLADALKTEDWRLKTEDWQGANTYKKYGIQDNLLPSGEFVVHLYIQVKDGTGAISSWIGNSDHTDPRGTRKNQQLMWRHVIPADTSQASQLYIRLDEP